MYMNYFKIQYLFTWFPFLVSLTPFTPPCFISKPSEMGLLIECFTHPHSSSHTPGLGAGHVPERKANNPNVQEMGQTEGSWSWKEFWK